MKSKINLLFFASFLSLAGTAQTLKEGSQLHETSSKKLLDPANLDRSVHPGDNFFYYANGTWLKNNPIPSTETRWGSFNELQEHNYKVLHGLLKKAAARKEAAHNTAEWKVGALYRGGMNTDELNKAGITPLKPLLDRIDAIKSPEDVLAIVAYEQTLGLNPLFSFYVAPDDKNVSQQIPQFFQGGLGMPDRDYYFKPGERFDAIRSAYQKYLIHILELSGIEEPGENSEQIFALEKNLANASMTRVEMRDPYKLYNKFSVSELRKKMPALHWEKLLRDMHMEKPDSLIVGMPAFFEEINTQLRLTSIDIWKNYLKFHLVNELAAYLSKEFDEAAFAFYGRALRGQEDQKPRWKRVLSVVDGSVGGLLGQMYVEQNFKPEAKKRMLELVDNLQKTYANRIRRLDWMSEATKKMALTKLGTFVKKIGYPDKWRDYSKLNIKGESYLEDVLAASTFEYQYTISKLGRPVDRSEWHMTPPTVNAYYNPAFNEIVFPAGILQYPFFDFAADDALNYGGIGAVIGHEMTHGFDDQGRQYDAEGNLKDWWTQEDARQFEAKAQVVVKQFNQYTVLDSIHVNGELTLGENLADLGGLAIAYEAFKKTEQGRSADKIDGFTPDQRFFLSWAQVWRANTRPEEIAARIVTDPHSPNEWRCNGPLSNMDAFYKAFNVQPGDKMYRPRDQRAKVW